MLVEKKIPLSQVFKDPLIPVNEDLEFVLREEDYDLFCEPYNGSNEDHFYDLFGKEITRHEWLECYDKDLEGDITSDPIVSLWIITEEDAKNIAYKYRCDDILIYHSNIFDLYLYAHKSFGISWDDIYCDCLVETYNK